MYKTKYDQLYDCGNLVIYLIDRVVIFILF